MRKLFYGFMALSAMMFTACDDDDDETNGGNGNDTSLITKSGEITEDETWTSDNMYRLDGRVLVTGGAELTIEPGTIIKAAPGQGAFASALVVTREGTINAAGTADNPIIFTSIADEIQPGEIEGTLDATNSGLWGGVIILGEAPISAQNDNGSDVTELQVEGIPTSVDAKYGGNNESDNSGVFQYVSIRHGGSNIGAGNEINGLTMAGVGSGTTINNIEIVANQDDGLEWFGGSVDVNNILVWNCGDDGLDTDQDWIGTASDFIIVTPRGGSCFELDGPEGTVNRGVHTIQNGIVYAGEEVDHLVDFDDNTNAELIDIYFYGIPSDITSGGFEPVESFPGDGQGNSGNWEYTLPTSLTAADVFLNVPSAALTAVGKNQNSVGPDASGFSWTLASQTQALASIGL